jgi:hypothetical protein
VFFKVVPCSRDACLAMVEYFYLLKRFFFFDHRYNLFRGSVMISNDFKLLQIIAVRIELWSSLLSSASIITESTND